MSRTVSPRAYRKAVAVAFVALAGIMLTGAAVRLTEAGLGCEDWPRCSEDRFVPEWGFHAWIEFGNRLISGVVAAAVAAAVLAAYWRKPRRRDLILWAWGLVAGVAAQIVLGGFTVLFDLHPMFVAAHYLLSVVLLWNALVLWVRAGSGPGPAVPLVPASVINHGRLLVFMAAAVLVTGTVVTGTGPHAGDARAERLPFELITVARIHGAVVWVFLLVTLLLALRIINLPRAPYALNRWLLVAVVAQGAVGYIQYALGVPAVLVEVHILGSIIVWTLAVLVHLHLFDRGPGDTPVRPDIAGIGASSLVSAGAPAGSTGRNGHGDRHDEPATVPADQLLDTMRS